jgi:hypothetical protein
LLECVGTYDVVAGEVDFGGSSAVVVVLVIFFVLIAAGVGVALFLKSKQKAPIGVAQTALMVPAPAAAVAVVPSAAPVAAAPVGHVASAAPAPAPAPALAPVDSLDSLAALAKVTKAELAAWELDDIREMMKDERTCPGGVAVPARKKIEVRRGPVACVVPFGTSTRAAVACVLADTRRCACVARRSGSPSGAAGLTLNSCVWS